MTSKLRTISGLGLGLAMTLAGVQAHAGSDSRLASGTPVVAAGHSHALLIKPDGRLYAWGQNDAGQIGDGTTTTRYTPVSISLRCMQVAAGYNSSYCIREDGNLMVWGDNSYGKLGVGSTSSQLGWTSTIRAAGVNNNWRLISAGQNHAMGIKIDGTLWGWGKNDVGALGLGTTVAQVVSPTRVGTDDTWISVAAGSDFTIALKADGSLWSTGWNASGQLGLGNTTTGHISMSMIGATTDHWLAVAVGTAHVVAIKDDGTLWAWGSSAYGELGDGTTTEQHAPKQISSSSYRAVSAGPYTTMAVRSDGAPYFWGQNSSGQLGLGDTRDRHSMTRAPSPNEGLIFAGGDEFTVSINSGGIVETFGINGGRLGVGSTPATSSTRLIVDTAARPRVSGIGSYHMLTVNQNAALEVWGSNAHGQLGCGYADSGSWSYVPNFCAPGNNWLATSGGSTHTLAIKADGTLYAWGANDLGQLGIGSQIDNFDLTKVGTSTKWLKTASEYEHSFGLRADGTLYGWGENDNAQLGDNSHTNPRKSPVQIGSGKRWVAITTSFQNGYGITSDGKLWAWGPNSSGQLGLSTSTTESKIPVQVGTATSWVTVGAGANFAVAIQANGKVFTWGGGGSQLGDNTTANRSTPTWISTSRRYFLLSVSGGSALASSDGGLLYGWGINGSSELGNGVYGSVNVPTYNNLFWAPRGIVGGTYNFLLTQVSTRQTAGNNERGQLGNGTANASMTPVQLP